MPTIIANSTEIGMKNHTVVELRAKEMADHLWEKWHHHFKKSI